MPPTSPAPKAPPGFNLRRIPLLGQYCGRRRRGRIGKQSLPDSPPDGPVVIPCAAQREAVRRRHGIAQYTDPSLERSRLALHLAGVTIRLTA